ncbi:MAG: hypothetical protein ACW98D_18245 [Promethearchaeota archaeon]|jgi:hypothetical protein
MISRNFCPECGKPLNNELENCASCGTPIPYETVVPSSAKSNHQRSYKDKTPKIKKKPKPLKNKFGFISWILLLLGAGIGLYALTTPAGSVKILDIYSWDLWMYGYNVVFESGVGLDVFWVGNEDILFVAVASTLFVIIGNVSAIIGAFSQMIKGSHKSYVSIVAPVILFGSPIFFLAGYEILMFLGTGESFWSLIPPAFGVYGQFLAALIMLPAFFITMNSEKYSKPLEKDLHQEKVYGMLKTLLGTKFLLEGEKNSLRNELEVISLRLKGVTSLKKKIGLLNMETQDYIHREDDESQQALNFFQQALELSSDLNQEVSIFDLNLAKKIIEQQDREIALNYLSEISDHTTILLGEMLQALTSGRRTSNLLGRRNSESKAPLYKSTSQRSDETNVSENWKEKIKPISKDSSSRFPPISELLQAKSSSKFTEESKSSDTDEKSEDQSELREEQEEESQKE